MAVTINDVCDYIITKIKSQGGAFSLSHLKLQKLLYYTQAWHLAFYEERMFDEKFQAWIHGPVSRTIFDRFKPTKSLYSDISMSDVRPEFSMSVFTPEQEEHIESVLETYAQFTGAQLEYMTHDEDPWIEARGGYAPHQRCTEEIDEQIMMNYYSARLNE